MKPFDFKYGRKQETDDEKEENMTLMEEFEDEDFGFLQQETEDAEIEENPCYFTSGILYADYLGSSDLVVFNADGLLERFWS
ncbi:hypothetical protein AVEN_203119-1 [Araneus ventricosus]|uniref:Uncharacterized protein n=1 Tax=Araneus ventricosus TaxID=182803 RepID=A0A4Y2DTC1_ARAVE|nr:hypothetical protein AVEN_203119-1 [Araneus ventricosus]